LPRSANTTADDDPSIRVIVLTGVGRAFCSGANLGAGKVDAGENFPGNRGTHEGLIGAAPAAVRRRSCPVVMAGEEKEEGAAGSFRGLQTVFWWWHGDSGLV
jgi:enoyl-CoA hydratase/carnithine racemase